MPEDGDPSSGILLVCASATAVPGVESIVIAGLVPAIHPFRKNMDARVPQTILRSLRKLHCVPAHDGENPRPCSLGVAGVGGDGLEPPTSCV